MEQAKQTFLAFFRREKLLKWVVALGLCGMALIYLSSFWTPEGEEPAPPADAGSSAEYSQSLEQELSRIISAITGEKSPAVLVTLEDSGRSLYAEDGAALPSRERPPARRGRAPMSFLRILKATSSLLPSRRPSRKCRGWWWSAPSQKTRLPGKNW